jgi:hypothetical protein
MLLLVLSFYFPPFLPRAGLPEDFPADLLAGVADFLAGLFGLAAGLDTFAAGLPTFLPLLLFLLCVGL